MTAVGFKLDQLGKYLCLGEELSATHIGFSFEISISLVHLTCSGLEKNGGKRFASHFHGLHFLTEYV